MTFNLRNRREDGSTPVLDTWTANSDYALLRDMLVGPAEVYQWLETSSLSKKSLRTGLRFDADVACRQNAEMVDAYRSAGVTGHFHAADPGLPYQIFVREASVMTPHPAVITNIAHWRR